MEFNAYIYTYIYIYFFIRFMWRFFLAKFQTFKLLLLRFRVAGCRCALESFHRDPWRRFNAGLFSSYGDLCVFFDPLSFDPFVATYGRRRSEDRNTITLTLHAVKIRKSLTSKKNLSVNNVMHAVRTYEYGNGNRRI